MKLLKIYDLRDAHEHIALVQKASSETKEYGFVQTHGLFGSGEWWKAIRDGTIVKYVLEGTIDRVYMSGHNDWPEFELNSCGERTRWIREGDASAYKDGKNIKLIYVLQRGKRGWEPALGLDRKVVLEIWVEE